jgi:UDP-galactopyranose mutase
MPTLLVFSHLRWDTVYQRPQHLLSRLAEHYKVCFFEEPVFAAGESGLESYSPEANVTVYRPHTPVDKPGFHDDQLPHLKAMVRQLVEDGEPCIVWFYTPMALPLLQEVHASLVVYDCVDEAAVLRKVPSKWLHHETALLKRAGIVFTGGPGLHKAKSERHPNVHCFPNSVDPQHFAQAMDHANAHPAHRQIPGPRLGFYGVIDERFDTALVARVAEAHPQWQIVLAGPVVGIDPATLPRHDNIHYLGPQSYGALPQLLAGWDVCLMPFVVNPTTRFISTTRSLEYMAAEVPIVSTPVRDVADLHGDVVAIAETPEQFITACETALLMSPEERAQQLARIRDKLAGTSWHATAAAMRTLMKEHEQPARESAAGAVPAAALNAAQAGAAPIAPY